MCVFQHGERGISIHSLRMEGDMRSSICGGTRKNFNPLPPHGGRPTVIAFYFGTQTISIHSLRMEGDSRKTLTIMYFVSFQSTPSAWRETTPRTYFRKRPLHFNPLPPHGGRHTHLPLSPMRMMYFNPLPPHGGRPDGGRTAYIPAGFQSTPSAWRETAKLHRKAFFISPILVQSCKKGCKRLHSAPEKMVFFEKREKNLVRNLQHLSVRL